MKWIEIDHNKMLYKQIEEELGDIPNQVWIAYEALLPCGKFGEEYKKVRETVVMNPFDVDDYSRPKKIWFSGGIGGRFSQPITHWKRISKPRKPK